MSIKCAFAKTEILSSLKVIEREYNKIYNITTPQNTQLMKSYAKIAVIALGGWVEDGMKNFTNISTNKIADVKNQQKINEMLDHIYGFSYKAHIFKKIVYTFGVHGLEFIESEIGDTNMSRLSSSLNNLKTWRDLASHSHVKVISWDPSRVISELETIHPILKNIEKNARKYRDIHF